MRRQTIALLLCAMLVGERSEATESLRRAKPIVAPPIVDGSLVAVRLDSDAYATSADGYGDLRVLGLSGEEVPFVVRLVTTQERRGVRQSVRVARPSVRPLPNDGLEITFAVDAQHRGAMPDRIVLATPLKDFEHRVTVAWSRDGSDWKPVVDDAVIYDYSRFMDVRDLAIPLPEPPGRGGQYRVVIDSVTQSQQSRLTELTRTLAGGKEREVQERTVIDRRPFRIDGIDLWYTSEITAREVPVLAEITPRGFTAARDPDGRATRITVDTRREPLTEITLVTTSRNFSRRASVERPPSDSRGHQRPIAAGTITQIDVAGIHRHNLSIPLPETREAAYEIVIDDGDSPPLVVTGVTARGPVREVVFLGEPGNEYRLAYGGSGVPPRYDTVAIDAALAARASTTLATLGEEMTLAEAPPVLEPLGWLADGRVQIAIIASLAILLALVLFRAAKRIAVVDEPRGES